jgi:hypothetical protein
MNWYLYLQWSMETRNPLPKSREPGALQIWNYTSLPTQKNQLPTVVQPWHNRKCKSPHPLKQKLGRLLTERLPRTTDPAGKSHLLGQQNQPVRFCRAALRPRSDWFLLLATHSFRQRRNYSHLSLQCRKRQSSHHWLLTGFHLQYRIGNER